MPLRFPKSARLSRASEFLRVKNEGESFHGKFIVLSVLKTTELETRIGFVTSRRVGNAVKRNKARRRMREMVRLARPQFKTGLWLVLIARWTAAGATFGALEQDWLRLAGRASILAE